MLRQLRLPFLRPRRPSRALLIIALFLILEPFVHFRNHAVPRPPADIDPPFYTGCLEPPPPEGVRPRERAALVMLARNSELRGAKHSMRQIEQNFNRWFRYPVVFLNNEPWSDEFKRELGGIVSGEAKFEVLPNGTWGYPDGVDVGGAKKSLERLESMGVGYGGNENYHHMCRFFSGDFFLLPALAEFRYYWRVEPSVNFFCSLTYDPFAAMARLGKVYGWTTALWEMPDTVPTLFRETSEYMRVESIPASPLWMSMVTPEWLPWPFRRFRALASPFSSDAGLRDLHGDKWNLCHFWSNFEIADLDFFRGAKYQKYYNYLLSKGGFYHERWGDAPIHSLALAMLLSPHEMHYFEDIGYQHDGLWVCPANAPDAQLPELGVLGVPREGEGWDEPQPGGIGCRCKCPSGPTRRRNTRLYCTEKMRLSQTRKAWWFAN